jgi:hypothetical protein
LRCHIHPPDCGELRKEEKSLRQRVPVNVVA